jgi:peptide/nickel transport system substrate-binding protein
VGDSSTRLAALVSGEANAIDRVEPDQLKVIESNGNLQLDRQLTIENKWFHFRNAAEPFKDNKLLRQAIAHGIDKQAIVDQILLGSGKVADSHVSPEQFGYAPAPNNIVYDPEKAKALLAEAGYPGGKGLPALEYVTSVGFYPKTKEYGQFIVDSLKEIGVEMTLTTKEVAAWNECLYLPDCGSSIDSGWLPTSLDPDVVLISQFYKGGIINGIDSPELNEALEAESFEVDPDKRAIALAEKTIPALMDEVPSFPLFVSELVIGTRKEVQGLDQLGNGYFFLKDAFISA